MFKAIILSSLAIFAAAHDGPAPTTVTTTVTVTVPAATVTTIAHDAQCYNTLGAADSIPIVGSIFGFLDIVLDILSVIVGLGYTPITILDYLAVSVKERTALSNPCAALITASTAL
ncbi:hypothetical protein M422DRAFT_255549 [Sphaerobolus stellatus SS14]|uniref:Hydrophobin n=1 Tax=Sphaerobolus stellatus (strain SS14) TaxID=990650 RepID=A0A0C9UEE3_SPHS4|nr:hypothetical protein M422DRAFT_255549 [Sphaerobolus stellatus SS14]